MSDAAFPEPSREARLGATVDEGGHVCFTLYAPGKRSVHLLGDFNGWSRDADPLEAGDDGTWTIGKKLGEGHHRYRYLIDGEQEVSDPYARRVAFDEGDPPREAVSIVEVEARPYQWKHEGWDRPPFRDLILYEIAVGDFSGNGLRGIVKRLDHIAALGVNCMELMPIFGFATAPGWGYDPTHFFAVHPGYGEPGDLKELVDEAHARGIAVVLDIVPAHTGTTHPFARLDGLDHSPYYSKGLTENEQEFGLPVLDYGKPGTRRFVADVLRHWLEEYRVDGFRIDYLKLIGKVSEDAVHHLVSTCRDTCEGCYLIGEHLPEDPEEINHSNLSGAWHLNTGRMLRGLLTEQEVDGYDPADFEKCISVLDARNDGYEHGTQVINYIESHDEERLVWELQENGHDLSGARRKLALAYTVIGTIPGESMFYAGQEWGEAARLDKEEQVAPLHWEKLDTEGGQGLFHHHQTINGLRRDHEAIRTGHFEIKQRDDERKVVVYHRWNDEGDEVLVAANFSGDEAELDVHMPRGGGWKEIFSDVHKNIDEGEEAALTWGVNPWSAVIFVRAQAGR